MAIKLQKSDSGTIWGDFIDLDDQHCLVRAMFNHRTREREFFLGLEAASMNIDQALAANLWPLIKHFAETGRLPEPNKSQ